MTAVNIIQKAGEILVMTDGLGLAKGGPRETTKVSLLPHLPLLVAVRGNSALAHVLTAKFASEVSGTFEDFLALLPELARKLSPAIDALQKADVPNEIYVVGFSTERSRIESWFMACSDAYAAMGRPAFTVHLGDEPMTAAPQPSESAIKAARFECPTARKFDPFGAGIKLMDAQRRTYPEAIGRFVQLSRVTRDGISSKIIHRWPNEL